MNTNIEFEHEVYNENYYHNIGKPSKYMLQIRKITKVFDYVFDFKDYSATLFAYKNPQCILELQKKFKAVYGYDINHISISEANKLGLEKYVKQQDLTINIENPFPITDISICFYLMEHLTDEQNYQLLNNMIKTSPILMIKMTCINEENYYKDETHINGKTPGEWKKMLSNYLGEYEFKCLFQKGNLYLYLHKSIFDEYVEKIKQLKSIFKTKNYNLNDYKPQNKNKPLF